MAHPTAFSASRFAHDDLLVNEGITGQLCSPRSAAFESQAPLRVHVERIVRDYFDALDGEVPSDVYELILQEVELPLLTVVLEKTRGNQSKSAKILGLNRGTLRKKLKKYQLMN